MRAWLAAVGKLWRLLNGDAEYERYLRHCRAHCDGCGAPPMNRKQFFADRTRQKWSGIKRCC